MTKRTNWKYVAQKRGYSTPGEFFDAIRAKHGGDMREAVKNEMPGQELKKIIEIAASYGSFSPNSEILAKLKEKAAVAGKDPETFLRDALQKHGTARRAASAIGIGVRSVRGLMHLYKIPFDAQTTLAKKAEARGFDSVEEMFRDSSRRNRGSYTAVQKDLGGTLAVIKSRMIAYGCVEPETQATYNSIRKAPEAGRERWTDPTKHPCRGCRYEFSDKIFCVDNLGCRKAMDYADLIADPTLRTKSNPTPAPYRCGGLSTGGSWPRSG